LYNATQCFSYLIQNVIILTCLNEGAISDYIVLARRKGENWYIGVMTDWDARNFDINLSFSDDKKYEIQFFKDGINTDRNAMDYKFVKDIANSDSKIHISMSSGGGWSAILRPLN
jgi:alpha-glucosidase